MPNSQVFPRLPGKGGQQNARKQKQLWSQTGLGSSPSFPTHHLCDLEDRSLPKLTVLVYKRRIMGPGPVAQLV